MIAASVSGAIVVNSQKRHALIGLVVLVQLINDIKLCSVQLLGFEPLSVILTRVKRRRSHSEVLGFTDPELGINEGSLT